MHAVIRKARPWAGEREISRHATRDEAIDAVALVVMQITNAGSGTRAEFVKELDNFEIREV